MADEKYSKAKARIRQSDLMEERRLKRLKDDLERVRRSRTALGSDDPTKRRLDPKSDIERDIMKVKSQGADLSDDKVRISGANPAINDNEVVKRISGTTDKIDTRQMEKIKRPGGEASEDSLKKLRKMLKSGKDIKRTPEVEKILKKIGKVADTKAAKGVGKFGLKSVPVIGGLVTALQSGDAAAGVIDELIPGGVEGLGGKDQAEFEELMHKLKKQKGVIGKPKDKKKK